MPQAIAGRHAQRRTPGEDAAATEWQRSKSEPTSGADAVGNAIAADVLVGEQVDPRRDMECRAT